LFRKKLIPPYAPELKDSMDLSYFDEEFTKKSVKDFRDSQTNILQENDQKVFKGFTFGEQNQLTTNDQEEED
jgi:hypothetical protein